MFEVTETAAEQLRKTLLESHQGAQGCFRVLLKENCLEMVPAEPMPDDVTLEHDDQALLVMDQETADRLSGHKLDYDEQVSRLVFI
jgi:Fe-S cluster assembly iron-binding protein IscA